MVLAISFLEAPLKFRAPGVTLQIGLGIGRMVFRALNTVEALLTVGILAALTPGHPRVSVVVRSRLRPPPWLSSCWACDRAWRAARMRCWRAMWGLVRGRITRTFGSKR